MSQLSMNEEGRQLRSGILSLLANTDCFRTTFDRDAKVAGRPIGLHTLYKMVMERGGYDALSAERMQWRTLAKAFGLGSQHEAVMTFQLKSIYYKNLA